jgi:Ca-activated chloride channel family protein
MHNDEELNKKLKAWKDEEISLDMDLKIKGMINARKGKGGRMDKKKVLIPAGALGLLFVGFMAAHVQWLHPLPSPAVQTVRRPATSLLTPAPLTLIQQVQPTAVAPQSVDLKAIRSLGKDKSVMSFGVSAAAPRMEKKSMGYVGGAYATNAESYSDSAQVSGSLRSNMMYESMPMEMPQQAYSPAPETREDYTKFNENVFKMAISDSLSTFSIDVDTASYSNVRRFLTSGQLPPADAVRIEEMVNYFKYDYPQPSGDKPFSVNVEYAPCPWNKEHDVLLVGLQGKEYSRNQLPASNLVFLIDVSGSMQDQNKLPLVQKAFVKLARTLTPQDVVSIVTYAGSESVVIDGARGNETQRLIDAINNLQSGGSTAGAAGLTRAYDVAVSHLLTKGNNRVIIATDGDFNVGLSTQGEIETLIEGKRDQGIFLSVLGFGMGNLKDGTMEKLADKGNGNYAYIDNEQEATKVFSEKLLSTLFTIAKDVKIQVEFNPSLVKEYRLIGYETRVMNKEDFANDKKDAGEIGSGHAVTALYEIVRADGKT